MTTIGGVNQYQRSPEPLCPQSERASRIIGVAFIALGAALLAGTGAGVAFAFSFLNIAAVPIALAGVVVVALAAKCITIGVHCLKAECWQDPSYVKKVQAKVRSMPLDEIKNRYGMDKVVNYKLLSKEEFTQKLLEKDLNFSELYNKYYTKEPYFIPEKLQPLFKKEVEEKGIGAFLSTSGYNQMKIFINDPWFQETLKNEIRGKTGDEIKKTYTWTDYLPGGHGYSSTERQRYLFEEPGFSSLLKKV